MHLASYGMHMVECKHFVPIISSQKYNVHAKQGVILLIIAAYMIIFALKVTATKIVHQSDKLLVAVQIR